MKDRAVDHRGQLEVICGCMFSGKTEELIRRLKRATYARQRVQVFKHALDDRYDELAVASHSGLKLPTVPASRTGDILGALEPGVEVVGIDEVQFFGPEIVPLLEAIVGSGVRVVVSGLDQDFRGEPFGPIPQLLARAEQIDKLSAICTQCGRPATRTQRLVDGRPAPWDSEVVSIGSAEKYEPRCRACHQVPGRPQAAPGRAQTIPGRTGNRGGRE